MQRTPKHQVLIHDHSERQANSADPFIVLERQHTVTLGSVRELDEAARSIREKGFTAGAFDSISRAASFLEEFFRKHDALEEKHLFPAVERYDPEQVRAFREEHRTIRNLFAGLLSLVRDIEGGRIHGSSVGDLLRTVREIVTLLRRHIIRESDILYPLIRKKLSAAEIDSIRKAMPAAEF
ncbi:MAG TPA: hemerythrin domain-containing protein [Bacteroidota bacterium]|nr:hemerythrin domain-containing protein [Bacteroidota bacterium]